MEFICSILKEECREVIKLNERMQALIELKECIDDIEGIGTDEINELVNKMQNKYMKTSMELETWWTSIIEKYKISSNYKENLVIEYSTNNMFLSI